MKIKTNIQNLKKYRICLKVEEAVHEFMGKKGYLKTDLPVLAPALIPESYLEIFETEFNYFNRQEKLYLTPSPELFMKRLLTRGIGNIYYLGQSFRNSEPNSSFHLPQFTMLEFYKVGAKYLELADEILQMMGFINQKLENPLKNLTFDRWEKFTVGEAFEKFANIEEKDLFDNKFFLKRAKEKKYKVENFTYQDIFSQIIAQEIEPNLGKNGRPAILYDYPKEMASLAKLSPDGKTARRVEFYINGIEIGGCCEELNNWEEQEKRFKTEELKRKQNKMIRHAVDKGFIETLKYGLPNCTGAGIGFERLAMIFANASSVDELKLINIQ